MGFEGDFNFNDKAWQKIIGGLQKKWKQIEARKEFGNIISAIVFKDVIGHFEEEKGPGGSWKPWSKMYADHMRAIGKSGNKILQDSGRLRQSFLPANFKAQSDGILFYNKAKVNGFPYAAAHDQGGKKLPQRKFMWLSDKGMNSVVKVVESWLMEGIEGEEA